MTSHLVLRRQLCPGFQALRRSYATSLRKGLGKKESIRKGNNHSVDSNILRPQTPCRTRFAPSPTGYLHLGSLRTALYNYLLAKATNGQFVLRLEDTDQSRLVPDAEQRLYEDLKWAGLAWDEGPDVGGPYGPYSQSERLSQYDEHSDLLIKQDKAYRCFCPPDELAALRMANQGNATAPPNPCRHISAEESEERAAKGEAHCVIFKASPEPSAVKDLVYGTYKKALPESDFILRKTDGFPTYHFANVIDDHAMKITHVIRGAEWLVSTPLHVQLYKALEWEPPAFAHVGLLVDSKRAKLSKRDLGADMTYYKENRILPAAVLNFAVLLGWRPQQAKDEVLPLEDMIAKFNLRFTKGDIMVQIPGKLPFLDAHHKFRLLHQQPPNMSMIQEYILHDLEASVAKYSTEQVAAYKEKFGQSDEPKFTAQAAAAFSKETKKITDPKFFLRLARFLSKNSLNLRPQVFRHMLWEIPEPYLRSQRLNPRLLAAILPSQEAVEAAIANPSGPEALRARAITSDTLGIVYSKLNGIVAPDTDYSRPWSQGEIQFHYRDTNIYRVIEELLEDAGLGGTLDEKKLQRKVSTAFNEMLRWALVAADPSVANSDVMEFLGREESLKRLQTGCNLMLPKDHPTLDLNKDSENEGFTWSAEVEQ